MSHAIRAHAVAVAALLASAAAARAQTIAGTVRSAGRPVVGANVWLLELDRTERAGSRGEFRFADVPDGTYRVFVAATGYASATDTVRLTGATASVAFDLVPSAIPLEQIVVSASPTARPADEAYQPSESMSRVQFDNSAGTSFAEKLSGLPGVAVRGNGSAPARPILRGLGDNEVLVLEDGLRMGDIATYDPAHATPIDAMSIARVDVVRGPATVLYGPNTIGGLVNVVTNLVPAASDHPLSGTVALEGNTVSGELAGYANAVATSGGSAFRLAAGGLHAGDIAIPRGTYTDPASGASFTLDRMPQSFDRLSEVGLGYSYQAAFGSIGVGGDRYETDYGIPGVPPNPDWTTAPPTTSRIVQQRTTLELRGQFNAGGWLQRVNLDASYNDYGHAEFPTAQDSAGVSEPQANHFHKRDLNAVLRLRQRPVGRLTGTVGLWSDFQDLTIEGDQPLGPNSSTVDLAAFGYEEYQAGALTRLEAGVRYDYSRIQTHPYAQSTDSVFRTLDTARLAGAFTASLGAVRQVTPRVTASFSVARSFRAPTVQELYANGLDAASSTYSIGTSTLGPETGLGVDASVRGNFGTVTFEVSPYLNTISHYIYAFLRGDTLQGFPVRQFGATRARLWGYEASLAVQAAPHVLLNASSDYVNAQDLDHGTPLPFIPPLRGLLRATWRDARWTGTVEWRMAARQSRLGPGDTPTAGYGVLDLGAGLRLVEGATVSEIGLHLDNALNTVYRDNLSVIKDFVPQPGRGVRLNYELLF